jgi:hypothetical protein
MDSVTPRKRYVALLASQTVEATLTLKSTSPGKGLRISSCTVLGLERTPRQTCECSLSMTQG